MSKGKHHASKKSRNINKQEHFSSLVKKILILIICFIILAIVCIFICSFLSKNKATSGTIDYNNSQVNLTKSIVGLESVKIDKLDIQTSSNMSIIKIFFSNSSNEKIDSCKVHLYLLDNTNKTIFGSSLQLPKIEPNSNASVKMVCSNILDGVADYKIVLE